MKKTLMSLLVATSAVITCNAQNNEKIPLGDSNENKAPADPPKIDSFQKELQDLPDGVLKVKTNNDGSFRSLIVKATVEIDEALGGSKAKRAARKEAEIQCKR